MQPLPGQMATIWDLVINENKMHHRRKVLVNDLLPNVQFVIEGSLKASHVQSKNLSTWQTSTSKQKKKQQNITVYPALSIRISNNCWYSIKVLKILNVHVRKETILLSHFQWNRSHSRSEYVPCHWNYPNG